MTAASLLLASFMLLALTIVVPLLACTVLTYFMPWLIPIQFIYRISLSLITTIILTSLPQVVRLLGDSSLIHSIVWPIAITAISSLTPSFLLHLYAFILAALSPAASTFSTITLIDVMQKLSRHLSSRIDSGREISQGVNLCITAILLISLACFLLSLRWIYLTAEMMLMMYNISISTCVALLLFVVCAFFIYTSIVLRRGVLSEGAFACLLLTMSTYLALATDSNQIPSSDSYLPSLMNGATVLIFVCIYLQKVHCSEESDRQYSTFQVAFIRITILLMLTQYFAYTNRLEQDAWWSEVVRGIQAKMPDVSGYLAESTEQKVEIGFLESTASSIVAVLSSSRLNAILRGIATVAYSVHLIIIDRKED